MKNQQKKCAHCGEEISAKAVVCPKCGVKNKKPIYKRTWFIILAIVVVIGIISSGGDDNAETQTVSKETVSNKAEEIVYEEFTVSQLITDLEDNALKAESLYNDKYVKLTGKLSVIDSDGKYISLRPSDNKFSFKSVQCYLKSDEQKSRVAQMNIDDSVTVLGKITDVGEVMGYSLRVSSFE